MYISLYCTYKSLITKFVLFECSQQMDLTVYMRNTKYVESKQIYNLDVPKFRFQHCKTYTVTALSTRKYNLVFSLSAANPVLDKIEISWWLT